MMGPWPCMSATLIKPPPRPHCWLDLLKTNKYLDNGSLALAKCSCFNNNCLKCFAYERLVGSEHSDRSLGPTIPPKVCTRGQLTSYPLSWLTRWQGPGITANRSKANRQRIRACENTKEHPAHLVWLGSRIHPFGVGILTLTASKFKLTIKVPNTTQHDIWYHVEGNT